jgi:hypothetical protein
MKKVAIRVLGLLGLFVSGTALASGPPMWSQATGIAIGIVDVEVLAGKTTTYLQFLPPPTGVPAGCTAPQAVMDTTVPENVKSMTAVATAAMLSGKPVRVHFSGVCGGTSPGTYPVIDGIILQNP